jgi:hypothetical protein
MDRAETRSQVEPAQAPPVRRPRQRVTTRGLMRLVAVAAVALFCGAQVSLRTHIRNWEARRVRMDLQRDLTRTALDEAMAGLAMLDRGKPGVPDAIVGPSNGTREWSIEIRKFHEGGRLGPARVKVSGAIGEFALKPITVEVDDPVLEGPWLERLLVEYRGRGWPYVVIKQGHSKVDPTPIVRSPRPSPTDDPTLSHKSTGAPEAS